MKITPRNPRQFKTEFDDTGRVCTKCGEFKLWKDFTKCSKVITGKTSDCKLCKSLHKKAHKGSWKRWSSVTRRKELKVTDPFKLKARSLRASLMRRSTSPELRESAPNAATLENWFKTSELICHYTGEVLTAKTVTVDHRVPLTRGGNNSLDNLCFASHHMNTAKGSLTEDEFLQLLDLVSTWEDKGKGLFRRLKQGWFA